jgi:hypothetical protein
MQHGHYKNKKHLRVSSQVLCYLKYLGRYMEGAFLGKGNEIPSLAVALLPAAGGAGGGGIAAM